MMRRTRSHRHGSRPTGAPRIIKQKNRAARAPGPRQLQPPAPAAPRASRGLAGQQQVDQPRQPPQRRARGEGPGLERDGAGGEGRNRHDKGVPDREPRGRAECGGRAQRARREHGLSAAPREPKAEPRQPRGTEASCEVRADKGAEEALGHAELKQPQRIGAGAQERAKDSRLAEVPEAKETEGVHACREVAGPGWQGRGRVGA
jgi:hypothetical protein